MTFYDEKFTEPVLNMLIKLYYRRVPVDQYKNNSGWYEYATVLDAHEIDYAFWQITGKHIGMVGIPTKEEAEKYDYRNSNDKS